MALILVTDDDNEFRATLRELLEGDGHTVLEAADGGIALQLLATNQVDLLTLDIVMPEKDGLETMMAIRKKHAGLKVLVISGGGRIDAMDYLKHARLMGAAATMLKPFKREQLTVTLRTLGIEGKGQTPPH